VRREARGASPGRSGPPGRVPFREFDALCSEVLLKIADLPERAEDFAAGTEAKVESMREWAEERGFATERMREAVENIGAGADRWLERGD